MSNVRVWPVGMTIAGVLLGIWSGSAYASCAPSLPLDICQVEEKIYLHTDFKKTDEVRGVILSLKQLLMDHVNDSGVVQEHLLGVVDQVVEQAHQVRSPRDILAELHGRPQMVGFYDRLAQYQAQNGPVIPLDWSMPSEIMHFEVMVTRGYNPVKDRTDFDFGFYSVLRTAGVLEQVQVIRYPNEVILDHQAGIGHWTEGTLGTPASPTVQMGTDDQETAQKEGLYLLNLKVKGKPMVNGWFILSHTSVSASPVVRTPSANEVFHTGNPTFHWTDFKSPEFQSFNQRKRMLNIYERASGARVWGTSFIEPDSSESMTLADAPNLDGVTELQNGSYRFKASFQERWFFGGMMLGRHIVTAVPFSVAK